MSPPEPQSVSEKIEHFILFPLILAALVGLCGWVLATGNRVAALEATQPTMQENIKAIREDVREIRTWALGR